MVGEVAVAIGVHRPVESLDHKIRRALAAEDLEGVKGRLRCDAGADAHGVEGSGGVPRSAIRRAVRGDAVSTRRACHMRAVTPAVERVVVGLRDGGGGIARVVGVPCQVDAARDLDRIGVDR